MRGCDQHSWQLLQPYEVAVVTDADGESYAVAVFTQANRPFVGARLINEAMAAGPGWRSTNYAISRLELDVEIYPERVTARHWRQLRTSLLYESYAFPDRVGHAPIGTREKWPPTEPTPVIEIRRQCAVARAVLDRDKLRGESPAMPRQLYGGYIS